MKLPDKTTILVCGGAGFIGTNFIYHLFKKYPQIKLINFDALTYCGNQNNLKDITSSNYIFIKGDITNQKAISQVFTKYQPNFVINFAAETHVDRSIHTYTSDFIQTNINGVFNLLNAVKNSKTVQKYLQVGTDEVYGSLTINSKKKFTEQNNLQPNSPYAASKACGDLLCRAYFQTWGIPIIITRCSNNYGPYQYPEKLIPFFVTHLLKNKKIPLYGDGKNVRDWIHVSDHCQALELCLFKGKPGEIYNIGANNEKNNLEVADIILKYFKRDKSWIEFVTDRLGHDERYAIDNSKIQRELGWRPKYTSTESLLNTIQWYIDQPKWLKDINKKINKNIKV